MIHIFRIYSKPSFGSLPNLFFRAKAGSLIVPVLIPSRRNALHSGGVGGGGGVLVARYANFQSFPPPFHRPSVPSPSPALPFPVLPSPRLASPHQRPLSIFPDSPSPILVSCLYSSAYPRGNLHLTGWHRFDSRLIESKFMGRKKKKKKEKKRTFFIGRGREGGRGRGRGR